MKQLNGADLAGYIKERQAKQVRGLRQAWRVFPRLAIVTDAQCPVIETYMRLKQRYGQDILIDVEVHRVEPGQAPQCIAQLNQRPDIHGIIVQLPLADPAQTDAVVALVAPEKDVDGLGPNSPFDAATPMAINWLLAGYSVELAGRRVAIVGRGRLVGAPLEKMWRRSGVDVTVFAKGDDLASLKDYDIIVSATGQPGLITNALVKPGATVVDAGTASEDGKLVGDVAPEVRQRQDIHLTPEKGGVGPLTVAALFDNVITAARQSLPSPELPPGAA
ncbi:MAG: bifunctional 5,10-methylenetetrahydrofolate dehydrogenase/5,10-methenyltetrahydrofolate cyclohydrolase [Candidatus Saccharibacteria bacterium]|nr:bifunctional 5,10-methylenetetrahydrofolate dehydrogenase/5,10-methenyltetrahydrofolate cyclohydrolase [Candidatus Saccharibacteria bacterium]